MIWTHIKSLIRHKWFVIIAGIRLGGIPIWRLLAHDLSKLSRAELRDYAQWFHGGGRNGRGFEYAWLHHQNRNAHHPEYWIERTILARENNLNTTTALSMPEVYIREMIADWMGASRAKTGSWDVRHWLISPSSHGASRFARMQFHDSTRVRIWEILEGIYPSN
jgi:hypothetical protein